jgi:uncharacterized protein (TIGR02145 family)
MCVEARFGKAAGVGKTIFRAAGIAAFAAVFCIGCADNGAGGSTGEESDTTTPPIKPPVTPPLKPGTPTPEKTTFTDGRDGKVYTKVTIGAQVWMAENLNYGAPDVTAGGCYANSADSCSKYGRLYSWETAMGGAPSSSSSPSGVRGVCPDGWHLPSDAEWKTLADYVGGEEIAGRKLKSAEGWFNDGNGTDGYGFTALPGGFGDGGGSFVSAGIYGVWWSATEGGAANAWSWDIQYFFESAYKGYNPKKYVFSVRCARD